MNKPTKDNKVVNIYYSGLDVLGFPPSHRNSIKWRNRHSSFRYIKQQILYLKVLSLFVDNIIIPPQSLVKLINYGSGFNFIKNELGDLLENGNIITSVYEGMSSPTDYLNLKLDLQFNKGINFVDTTFFADAANLYKNISFIKRNPYKQSENFQKNFFKFIENSKKIKNKSIVIKSISTLQQETLFNRKSAINSLNYLIGSNQISCHEYNLLFQKLTSAYYIEGAIASNSYIACINAHEYSNFDDILFKNKNNRILIGYDPKLLLNILNNVFLISNKQIYQLTAKDILEIKRSKEFVFFRKLYEELISTSQDIYLAQSNLNISNTKKYTGYLIYLISTRISVDKNKFMKINNIYCKYYFLEISVSLFAAWLTSMYVSSLTLNLMAGVGATLITHPAQQFVMNLHVRNLSFYTYLNLIKETIFKKQD